MLNFDDMIESDHLNMINSKEFGIYCLNTRTNVTFNIIKTDAFLLVDGEGIVSNEEKPMFNTSKKMINSLDVQIDTDIKQYDNLVIDGSTFIVRDTKNDGIGGIDIYLKFK